MLIGTVGVVVDGVNVFPVLHFSSNSFSPSHQLLPKRLFAVVGEWIPNC